MERLNDLSAIKTYYQEYGYVVVKEAIPPLLIDDFLQAYEQFKKRHFYTIRSQDTNRIEKIVLTPENFMEHSMLNPLGIPFAKKFTQTMARIVFHEKSAELLQLLSNKKTHTVWQSMFFDKSTGTAAHQDHYYLDSYPHGQLVGCWYSLEDIQEEAGAFFVVPKSHQGPLIRADSRANYGDHQEYIEKIHQMIDAQNYQPHPCFLQKGDLLLWHPFLIHGAFLNKNPRFSRKSFTAHFLPEGYQHYGAGKILDFEETYPFNEHFRISSISDPQKITLAKMMKHCFGLPLTWLRPSKAVPKMEMRVQKYENLNWH